MFKIAAIEDAAASGRLIKENTVNVWAPYVDCNNKMQPEKG